MTMQLASMVHGVGRDQQPRDAAVANHYQQQNLMYAQPRSRALQQHHDVGSCLPSNPYATHQPFEYSHSPSHSHSHSHSRAPPAPQSPPSPPVEEIKPSLPSISSLLGIADGEKNGSETAAQGTPGQLSPQAATHQSQPQQPQPQPAAPVKNDYRPEPESQAYQPTIVSNPRMTLPPTPPMHPDTVIDGNQSPSVASQSSLSHQQPYYLGQSLNNMEPHQQRQHAAPVVSLPKRQSLPQQPNVSPYAGSQYAASPAYGSSPAQATASGYYSPESAVYPPPSAGMYAQRALPTTFAPQLPMHMVQPPTSTTANPWQHHHYISHSSQAAFPQSNDRYICTTCNKAFSRPSSLRIHSHSHTGEKPYKCPQPGCGKAFSVRSNMKRHERGCHTVSNGITTS